MYVCMHVRTYIRTYVCMYVCMYTYRCMQLASYGLNSKSCYKLPYIAGTFKRLNFQKNLRESDFEKIFSKILLLS